jgi:4-amino-4-deoxy-L-arabinose transferase-like glycosyltransferase
MRKEILIVGILLAFIVASGLYYAVTNSITSDELTHITAGYINLKFNDYRFNIEHPPFVKQLAALPLLFIKLNFPMNVYKNSSEPMDIVKIQDAFLFSVGNDLDLMLLLSRIPNILIAALLGFFIYLYSKKLNGFWAGATSLALFAFSPSFLGHAPLVTMDTSVSCLYFMTIYFLMRYLETARNLYLSLTGVFLGLSLISKFSALILIPVIVVLVALSSLRDFKSAFYHKLKPFLFLLPLLPFACSYKSSFRIVAPFLCVFVFFNIFFKDKAYSRKILYACAVLLVILTIAFIFTIVDYTDYKWFPFHSATKAYFKGFSSFEGHASAGQGESYLLGMHSGKGWWYYFPLALLFKEPALCLIFFLSGLIVFLSKKEGMITKALILLPLLAYLFVAMGINKVNIGIRHLLPIYPFMFVICGYCVRLAEKIHMRKHVFIALVFLLATDVLSAYPAHLSYISRLFGGIESGHILLGDSNLAWGQDWKRMSRYVRENNVGQVIVEAASTSDKNCAYYGINYRPMTLKEKAVPGRGIYVLERTALAPGRIAWYAQANPAARVGGSLLVYNITDDII